MSSKDAATRGVRRSSVVVRMRQMRVSAGIGAGMLPCCATASRCRRSSQSNTAAATAQDATRTDPDKYRVLLENEHVRVLGYRDLPDARTHEHQHPPFVVVAVVMVELKPPPAAASCGRN